MIEVAVLVVTAWASILGVLLTPKSLYVSSWDRITKARYRSDRVQLQIMLDHLRSYPEQWSVDRDGASFPAESKAKQIYLSRDKTGAWKYNLSSFGTESHSLDGHFAPLFTSEIAAEVGRRESRSLLRNFYPEINNTLLLEKYS